MKQKNEARVNAVLLFSVFVIAVCGLIYELLAGTLSSYLLGDSVYQFSMVVGAFVSSMGFGSFLSRYVDDKLPDRFVLIELIIGVLGGYSTLILLFAFTTIENYSAFLWMICISLGALIGLEIPLVLRILKKYDSLKITASNVLSVDYIGALVAGLLFPIILVPKLGLVRTSLLFGVMNVLVALLGLHVFKGILKDRKPLFITAIFATLLLGLGFYRSNALSSFLEDRLYQDEIIFSANTPYQRVVVTRSKEDVRMFINGSIQFNTRDEYRYHESLVHPAMSLALHKEKVLILGGGDGMTAREVLKYKEVQSVTVVDIDKAITDLFKNNEFFKKLNDKAFSDKRIQIVNLDAWKFLENSQEIYDVVIIDLPDPDGFNLSKLYSHSFYRLLSKHLSSFGIIVTQASSPLYSREAFWCIFETLSSVESPVELKEKLQAQAYHVYIPSFGEWGFVMASPARLDWNRMELKVPTRFLSAEGLKGMIQFPNDMNPVEVEINTLDTHKVVTYYEAGWSEWHL